LSQRLVKHVVPGGLHGPFKTSFEHGMNEKVYNLHILLVFISLKTTATVI